MTLTAADIAKYAAIEKRLHDEIHRTFQVRDCGKKKLYEAWSNACNEWHSHKSPFNKLWSSEFKAIVKAGDREAINELITYLEVDPYYFRSGYLKGRLVRMIKGSPRSTADDRRLRSIIWNRAGGTPRAEFREYCRLATLISTPTFRDEVAKKSKTLSYNNFKLLITYLK